MQQGKTGLEERFDSVESMRLYSTTARRGATLQNFQRVMEGSQLFGGETRQNGQAQPEENRLTQDPMVPEIDRKRTAGTPLGRFYGSATTNKTKA